MQDQKQDKAKTTTPNDDAETRPAAGPHAAKELTNPDATPGAGALPDPDEPEVDGGAG